MCVRLSCQTCLIPIDSLLEAFDVFPEFPSLEYKIWRSLAVKISTTAIMEHIIYQVSRTFSTPTLSDLGSRDCFPEFTLSSPVSVSVTDYFKS